MRAVIDTATKAAQPIVLFQSPTFAKVYVPSADGDGEIKHIDLEPTLPAPSRKKGTVTCFDVASFNQLIADNSDAGNISIYLDRNPVKPAIVAVLNGHGKPADGKSATGWGDFRVQIEFRKTPQWLKWSGIDGKMMPQVEFAEFVENNLADIVEPPGATMLEIATYLQTTRSVDFKSGIRLSSGAIQFQNLESLDTKVGAGNIEVPEMLTLGLQPFIGSGGYKIPTRFRYRLNDGKLTLGIKMQRIETMMDELIETLIAKIERGANISVLDGLPPS
jgi:uncharacterized protein YfdQ (DUF2303 family)